MPEYGHVDRLCIDARAEDARSGCKRERRAGMPRVRRLHRVDRERADRDRDRGIDGSSDSGPGRELLAHFGIPPAAVAESAQL